HRCRLARRGSPVAEDADRVRAAGRAGIDVGASAVDGARPGPAAQRAARERTDAAPLTRLRFAPEAGDPARAGVGKRPTGSIGPQARPLSAAAESRPPGAARAPSPRPRSRRSVAPAARPG